MSCKRKMKQVVLIQLVMLAFWRMIAIVVPRPLFIVNDLNPPVMSIFTPGKFLVFRLRLNTDFSGCAIQVMQTTLMLFKPQRLPNLPSETVKSRPQYSLYTQALALEVASN